MTPKYNVLLVDDDALSLCILENIIEKHGQMTILQAENGFAALEIMAKEKVDFLITDFSMPGMDGVTLMKACQAAYPSLITVIQSAANELTTVIDAIKSGAFDFITKPIEPPHLLLTLDKCIEKKLLEQKVAEQSEKLKLLTTTIEQSTVSIVITDREGCIQYVNPHFCHVTGYTVEEAIGNNPRMLQSGTTPPEFYKNMWETILAGKLWKGEIQNRKKNGELYWERITISPVYNVQGESVNRATTGKAGDEQTPALSAGVPATVTSESITNFIAIKEDITYEKHLEAERVEHAKVRQQEQLRAMNQGKLASLGEIATGIAHEINQPLTFINTLLHTTIERFEKNVFDVAKLTVKFEKAIHQAARITTIIDHLRTFGRADDAKVTRVSMETILDNALILMQERIRLKNIVILREIDADLPSILGNSHTLEQIFINFFQNSIDAMEEQGGGTLKIAMTHEPGGNAIQLCFADSGPGMNAEVQAKMFEPFYTTKEIGKGTGLGLSLVFGIVQDHHGEIVCHSEPGKGTTFSITLPIPAAKNEHVV